MPSPLRPPVVERELRAAWVATVGNIDWPSTNRLSTAQQKAELIGLMDRAVELKLNTIILQVRPACDAIYPSSLEPWSEYLTGTMGQPPRPFYDPLAFAVEQAHKRGLELHAWFNPFRARQASAKSPISPNHVSRTHPEFVRKYGKMLWLDPGEKAAQAYSLQVVMDVVRRYDIDGVHFDDYFYPYKEQDAAGRNLDFPDSPSWSRFGSAGKLSRDDWRRENVNAFVRRVYDSIKQAKPWVKFGISPFGIWRPGSPIQIQGFDPYASLYADSRQWLFRGWVDYLVPQLYWAVDPPGQSFPVLLKWWAEQNPQRRILAPGIDCTKAGRQWPAAEIVRQIRLARSTSGVRGQVHWSMKALMRNSQLAGTLEREVYSQPALSPACDRQNREAPSKPELAVKGSSRRASWKPGSKGDVWQWLVQTRNRAGWSVEVLPKNERGTLLAKARPEVIALTALDR
ncbi:MAG TPA: family 10 glycosylhydrolase, partial [Verrucomicrobiae bacterium]|nr:family 10 glycosylhydrolase [Verrucomicrobiae bacterium]